MNGAVIQKVCGLCGQDCANRPRTRDRRGRYFCSECYDRAIARQRRSRGDTTPPPSPRPTQPASNQRIDGGAIPSVARTPPATRASTPAQPSPPLLPSHAALLLPPAPAPVAPNGDSAYAASTTVDDASPRSIFSEAPDIDAERPAAPLADARQSEPAEHESVAATTLHLIPDDSGTIVAQAQPPSLEPPSHGAPPMALSVAPEPEPVEPSAFELEPEDPQNWLAVPESTTDEQHAAAATSDATDALSSSASSPASAGVATAAQTLTAPLPLRERRQAALDAGPLPAAFVACAHCARPMPTGAVICLACGFNTMSGVRCDDDVARPITRRRARSGWTGPILVATTLTLLALGGGYLLFGTQTGVLAYGIALALGIPAWFAWALLDARDTEGAQLKIWLVPGYIIAWVFGESRSRYLRAATVALSVAAIAFTAMAYQWRQQERQGDRPALDQRAGAVTTDPSFP